MLATWTITVDEVRALIEKMRPTRGAQTIRNPADDQVRRVYLGVREMTMDLRSRAAHAAVFSPATLRTTMLDSTTVARPDLVTGPVFKTGGGR